MSNLYNIYIINNIWYTTWASISHTPQRKYEHNVDNNILITLIFNLFIYSILWTTVITYLVDPHSESCLENIFFTTMKYIYNIFYDTIVTIVLNTYTHVIINLLCLHKNCSILVEMGDRIKWAFESASLFLVTGSSCWAHTVRNHMASRRNPSLPKLDQLCPSPTHTNVCIFNT